MRGIHWRVGGWCLWVVWFTYIYVDTFMSVTAPNSWKQHQRNRLTEHEESASLWCHIYIWAVHRHAISHINPWLGRPVGELRPFAVCPFCNIQYNEFARYATGDWPLVNVFPLVYFCVAVSLKGLYHHSVSWRTEPCVRVSATPRPASLLTKRRLGYHWLFN